MYRNGTIITKIRPIKKLCIIEENDLDRLIQIINVYSMEVTGILNLILINNENLNHSNTIDFIQSQDPDVIINYSLCDNNKLKSLFKTLVVDGVDKKYHLDNLATDIEILDNIRDASQRMQDEDVKIVKDIYTSFNTHIDPKNMVYYLNYGLVDKRLKDDLRDSFKNSIFEGINLKSIKEDTLNPIGKLLTSVSSGNLNNILFLSVFILWPIFTESISIHEIDYNKNNYYKKSTIIFGHQYDVESMVYFWNERATYPFLNHIIWLPLEFLDEYMGYIHKFENFCVFSRPGDDIDDIMRRIRLMNASLIEIDNSKFYFRRKSNEWESFKFKQNISIIDNKFTIRHPSDKLFSLRGANANTVLEIYGIEELSLPKSLALGDVFREPDEGMIRPRFNDIIKSHLFSRISSRGLAFEFDEFEPFGSSPLIYDVCLPDDKLVFESLLQEHQLHLMETNGSQVIEQVINLVNGFENLEILNEERIFDLLVELAPKRIRRIVKDIIKEIGGKISEGYLETLISENINTLTTINSNVIINTKDLLARFPKGEREKYGCLLQQLYENKILLRGRSFKCPHCNSTLWYSLSALNDDLKCYCCGNSVILPILIGSATLEDSFKLNELICNVVDQGILPLLLTTSFLFRQRFCGKRFIFNNKICDENSRKQLAEVDIIFTLGKLIGIVEVKADRGFEDHGQIDRLLDISERINADLILFSTIKSKYSEEVQELVRYLETKETDTSIFILPKEVLFEKELINLGDYTNNILSSDKSQKKLVIIDK